MNLCVGAAPGGDFSKGDFRVGDVTSDVDDVDPDDFLGGGP